MEQDGGCCEAQAEGTGTEEGGREEDKRGAKVQFAQKREVEGPKAPPTYVKVGEIERLPDDLPDGTVLSDANIGALVGSRAVAQTPDGAAGAGTPVGPDGGGLDWGELISG